MQKAKVKEFFLSLFMCMLGILGIAIMVKYIADWTGWGPVWETDPNTKYLSNDISARFSSCLYFTNITLFIFCIYTILNFISVLFNIEKLKSFLRNPYVLLFIGVNQLLVMLVYTLMIIVFGVDVSTEILSIPGNRHNFAASLFKHYVLTIAAVVFVMMQKPRKKVNFKKCLWFLAYPIGYAILVKILGKTCFVYEWYPYPFFGVKHLWYNLFGSLENYNFTYSLLIIIACLLVIAGIYILLLWLASRLYNKLASRGENKVNELVKKV